MEQATAPIGAPPSEEVRRQRIARLAGGEAAGHYVPFRGGYLKAPVEFLRIQPKGADEEMIRPFNPNTLAPVIGEVPANKLVEASSADGALVSSDSPAATDNLDEVVAVTCAVLYRMFKRARWL